MIDRASLAQVQSLTPQQKANLIYSQAQNEMRASLWKAALASGDDTKGGSDSFSSLGGLGSKGDQFGLDNLLQLLSDSGVSTPAAASLGPSGQCGANGGAVKAMEQAAAAAPALEPVTSSPIEGAIANLGPNAVHQGALQSASERTGMPPSALAAIVDAEAARGPGGGWNPYSRNSRSSAAGLGQFLSGTWVGMAQQSGTWLNAQARANGWLNEDGKVKSEAKSALLALRYDARASIETTADYARDNINRLRRNGVAVADDVKSIASAAYLGHHLGPQDALDFYRGGLSSGRARVLLNAQIGASRASEHIANAGDASSAHRNWLTSYIGNKVRPERYAVLETAKNAG